MAIPQERSRESGEEIRGREAVRDFILALHTQLFDAAPELRSLTSGDGVAAIEADFVGKHIAEFGGVMPTGISVRVPYAVFYDLADGKITKLRAYLPVLALVQQLQS